LQLSTQSLPPIGHEEDVTNQTMKLERLWRDEKKRMGKDARFYRVFMRRFSGTALKVIIM